MKDNTIIWATLDYIPAFLPQLEKTSPTHLTFIGPSILIYFYSKTNQMHQCLKLILLE